MTVNVLHHAGLALAVAVLGSSPVRAAESPGPVAYQLEIHGIPHLEIRPAMQMEWMPGEDVASQLELRVDGEHLSIRCLHDCENLRDTVLHVGLPRISAVTLLNGGRVTAASEFPVQATLTVNVHNGGELDARALPALQVQARLSNGGDVRVSACNDLDARLMQGGRVRYRGSPRLHTDLHNGGEVYALHSEHVNACQHMVDVRDQRRYATVTLGAQEWFAENLAWLPDDCATETAGCGVYVYGLDATHPGPARTSTHYKTFGALYDWPRAKIACPAGWRLPSDEDWQGLEQFFGLSSVEAASGVWRGPAIADRLKLGGNSGLQVLLAGWRSGDGRYNFQGEHANFWTATPAPDDHAIERLIGLRKNQIGRHTGRIEAAFSVRCMRDRATAS